jgi:hypothetical protein
MKIVREAGTEASGYVPQHALRRPSFPCRKIRSKAIKGGAIRADDLAIIPKIEKDVRMIKRGVGADAHELLRAYFDDGDAGIVMEVRDNVIGHPSHLE